MFQIQPMDEDQVIVTADNFVRAQSHQYFAKFHKAAGGVNTFAHIPVPWPVDKQIVIRTNRDTLYSFAVIDIGEGATVTMPDPGDRYQSLQVVTEDHYTNKVFRGAGEFALTMAEFPSRHVAAIVRVLVDPNDPEDFVVGQNLQAQLKVAAGSDEPFAIPDYDMESFKQVYDAVADLAVGIPDSAGMFGSEQEVDPIRHLIGAQMGWGGLPQYEAAYEIVDPELPVGEYEVTVSDVPCDAFWSVTVYGPDGFMKKNSLGVYNINNVKAARNDDGSVTVRFGGCGEGKPNCIPIMEGWNYIVRFYAPRQVILDGDYSFPLPT